MPNRKPPATYTPEVHDPYAVRGLEQMLALFDGGDFLARIMEGHKDLQAALREHLDQYGNTGCNGSMTIKVSFALGSSGDVAMNANVSFDKPKKPAAKAAAYVDEGGQMSLMSPMMKRMHGAPRDVSGGTTPMSDYDPETGEVRDV